jgi:hypothetical protein
MTMKTVVCAAEKPRYQRDKESEQKQVGRLAENQEDIKMFAEQDREDMRMCLAEGNLR